MISPGLSMLRALIVTLMEISQATIHLIEILNY